uniref:Uncharacterized protein n=1 Tax=Moschus moschiferus TaxID=68415 RepID=A0A8C6CR33_MOSMO
MGNQPCTSGRSPGNRQETQPSKQRCCLAPQWDHPERAPNGGRLPHLLQHHQAEFTHTHPSPPFPWKCPFPSSGKQRQHRVVSLPI